jgi:hypothetical protein
MSDEEITYTTIKIAKTTAKELKAIKITKLETYDEILNRILKFFKENKS